MKQQVAVTGMGIVTSVGKDVAEFSNALRAGECGIGTHVVEPHLAASIADFSLQLAVESSVTAAENRALAKRARECGRRSSLGIQVAIASVLQAWEQALLDDVPINSQRLGLVVGGSNLTRHYQHSFVDKFQQSPEYLSPRYAMHYLDTDYVGTLSEIFQIQGEGFTVGAASASGSLAILRACELIRCGIVEACVVVGALTELSAMELQAFANVGAMGGRRFRHTPHEACRPFDRDHEGFIYGQASACMILESTESASRRKVPALARVLGGAQLLSGNRLTDPCAKTEAQVIQRALQSAGVKATDVDYVNTHGTSSPLGDTTEIQAIKNGLGNCWEHIWLNSTKGIVGHCLNAAGVVECIATVLQMQGGFVHPNRNLINPIDNACRFSLSESVADSIEVAMSLGFGFGGFNSSIILTVGE